MKVIFAVLLLLTVWSIMVKAQPAENLYVTISGDTVHIWNANVQVNCGCLFRMDVTVRNDTVFITEVDTSGGWMTCTCSYNLCASVTGLRSGSYAVRVFRYMPLFYPDTIFFAGSTSFVYGGATGAITVKSYQSACSQINSAGDELAWPEGFRLAQNYPNPFNPSTTICYELPVASYVTLGIFNVLGQKITTLIDGTQEAGVGSVEWDGTDATGVDIGSGIYLCRITASEAGNQVRGFTETRKVILVR